MQETPQNIMLDIAVIGMACRVPGAKNIDEFWDNLQNGVESVQFFADQDLQNAGIDPNLIAHPNYVKASPSLEDIEYLDAAFFGFSPRETELMDPQNRLFLESAWEALENAGYNTLTYEGLIGVYAGSAINRYLLNNLIRVPSLENLYGFSSEQDFLTTNVSYKLNLKGPSLNVQTFCSTSLVAVHLAVQSLLNQECDMALAGGVTIHAPHKSGYLYHQGDILSPDGHCRSFDAKAQGTVFGSGVGIVVLKRLEDAISDGDRIDAVIKGSAINNDGSLKVSFTSPSVNGQVDVIISALDVAGISAETISYIEAHGTATEMGDPIEIAALTQAFRRYTNNQGFCAIGTVKTNFGHLMAASGVTGLIKTVLALKHQKIPPSLHFEHPNPKIDFANSPFYVNASLSPWHSNGSPRRAGVSSLGFGGTNAHVVLEEAPQRPASSPARAYKLLVLSAKTDRALEAATLNLAQHLKLHPELDLADIAYTLQVGRQTFNHRRMVVCNSLGNHQSNNLSDAVNRLEAKGLEAHEFAGSQEQEFQNRPVIFMFSGQGSQYVKMSQELYAQEPIFREHLDRCCDLLLPHIGLDLRSILYPSDSELEMMAEKLLQTAIAQPAIFAMEYALTQLWLSWGIKPKAMIGHSLGEYVAACISGVFCLADALKLVAVRGRLMQALPKGKMLAVPIAESEIIPLLTDDLAIAAINHPTSTVVSGCAEAIDHLELNLQKRGIDCRQLHTSHAFHSAMMEPMLEEFGALVAEVKFGEVQIPFVSNLSGDWASMAQVSNPTYWVDHIRNPVRFSHGLQTLFADADAILLEIGAGRTLSTIALRHPAKPPTQLVLNSLRHANDQVSDQQFILTTLGRLWLGGAAIDWEGFYDREHRYRVALPTYPFERQRFWIEPGAIAASNLTAMEKIIAPNSSDVQDWFYASSWQSTLIPDRHSALDSSLYLVFISEVKFGESLIARLHELQHQVITVKIGSKFEKVSDRRYLINPNQSGDYDYLVQTLQQLERLPEKIVHLWNVTEDSSNLDLNEESIAQAQTIGLYSLLFLTQAIAKHAMTNNFALTVISNNMQSVTGQELIQPEKATLLGACKVIPQEYANICCQSIDISLEHSNTWQTAKLIENLCTETALDRAIAEPVLAYRGNRRWSQTYKSISKSISNTIGIDSNLSTSLRTKKPRKHGIYVITGGLGGLGLIVAGYLAQNCQARLVLVGRSTFPSRSEWEQWLETHGSDDVISQKIRKLQIIESHGAEIFIASADVANFEQMTEVFEAINQKWGLINGLIHAAGVLNEQAFQEIGFLNQANCAQQLLPKVNGLIILERVLRSHLDKNLDSSLDFCLLFSSLSSILGGVGYFAYAAANLFMDAFADRQQQLSQIPWRAINWDSWQLGELNDLELGISPKQGMEVLQLILNQDSLSQVAVSSSDLDLRLNQWINANHNSSRPTVVNSQPATLLSLHNRPNLSNLYAAPNNQIEQSLANIWQEFLGISQIGIDDNFFELGGDSLLITRIISRLRGVFQIELSHRDLFEHPTIALLGQVIESKIANTIQPEPKRANTTNQIEGEL